MTQIILMRHSISVANEQGICDSGRHDAPLSEGGEELARQCAGMATWYPDAIYCSDMKRAKATADIYALALEEKFGIKVPVITISKLRGRDEGLLEGVPFREIKKHPILEELPDSFLEKEAEDAAMTRQKEGFLEVSRSAEQSGFQIALVVTHSDSIVRFLLATGNIPAEEFEMPHNCQQLGPFDSSDVVRKLSLPDRPKPPAAKPPKP